MYADDTALLTTSRSAEELEINAYISLSMAQDYCEKNDLVFNETKTKQMNLGRLKDRVSGLLPHESCRQVFKDRGILTVTAIYILEVILHATKKNLKKLGDFRGHATRNAQDYILPLHRMELFTKKPSYAGAKLFNLLPFEIKRGDNNTLKRRLRNWLLEETIYTLNEFIDRCRNYRTT
uniref:Reverse transcriptase domain-containing protein n=1 Tax=Homalodisca liturata TaxID=320908 RepID=A0A1B6HR94_9HEMI